MALVYKLLVVSIVFAWIFSEGKQEKKVLQRDGRKASPTRCEEGSHALNQCEERCECWEGQLTNCYRVRKEFTKMNKEERKRFINTYKTASVDPAFRKDYEKMVAFHIRAPDDLLHNTPKIFFPWHRWYLVQFENLLRRIDCRVTVPYWDWSRLAHHWWRGSGNKDLWNSGEHGLGGDGNLFDHCVDDGPFSKDKWRLLNISLGGGCLKRYFWYVSFTGDTHHVNKTLALPLKDFLKFEGIVREIYHAQVHDFVGGTMLSSGSASNAPEIVLHHSFLDKLWLEWQKKGEEYKNVFFPNLRLTLPGSKYHGWQWMDSNNLPGHVKVLYQD